MAICEVVDVSNEELVAAIQSGQDRMGELWAQVEKLVMWKAHRIMGALEARGGCGVTFEDLYQSGYPALVDAVETYDPAAGAFTTWLMYYLRKAFAEATGYCTRKGQNEPLNNSLSLDTPLTDETDSDDLMAIIADPAGMNGLEAAEVAIYHQQLHDALEKALDDIPDQYSEVLRQRHYEGLTLAEIGERRGTTPERIRQMESKAVRLMRKPSIACHIRPFYDFDFYCGTGLGAFQHTGMSIQERYLVIEEERKEKAEQQRQEREHRQREKQNQRAWEEYAERTRQQAEERISRMTPEEKARLLAEYGYM